MGILPFFDIIVIDSGTVNLPDRFWKDMRGLC